MVAEMKKTRTARLLFLWLVVACVGGSAAHAGTMVFDSRKDWEWWTLPGGALRVTEDGWVVPTYIRKRINACLDAKEFVVERDETGNPVRWGGIKAAGSNASAAASILDGNPGTSWGPIRDTDRDGSPDPEDWWVEVDLGRVVTADSVRIVFSRQADPFEQFKVYVSDGTPAFHAASGLLDYTLLGRTFQPNREVILKYEVPLTKPQLRQVRYVLITVTSWSHPEDDPELAELEVYTPGENVALGTFARRGNAETLTTGGVVGGIAVIDGDATTSWNSHMERLEEEGKHGWAHIDLGSRFWVDTIFIIGAPRNTIMRQGNPLTGYELDVSDGSQAAASAAGLKEKGPYVWDQVGYLPQNPPEGKTEAIFFYENMFSLRPVERIFLRVLRLIGGQPAQTMLIKEIQVYGHGYTAAAAMRSQLIDLSRSSSLTSLEWVGETPPGTEIQIRTRTGDRVRVDTTYYRKGKQVTKRDYERIPDELKPTIGEVRVEVKPDEGYWSSWSQVYPERRSRFLSPSPRQYLLTEARLVTQDPEIASSLDKIILTYTDPVAETVQGEIWPRMARAPAKPQRFSYFIRPSFTATSRGFDEIFIQTPSPADSVEVRIDDVRVDPDFVRITPDSLRVRLPRARLVNKPSLVEVRFVCTVFLNGTPFEALVGNSRIQDSWQRVDEGDPNPSVDSQTTTVSLPVSDDLIGHVSLLPETITPNGDGRNDEMVVAFTVFKVNLLRPVEVIFYDLKGTVVRMIEEPVEGGDYRILWDGRDRAGRLVPPGLYLCQIRVHTDWKDETVERIVAVAY
jgi:hypothetical protein